jgi:uncharacterized glyoxalase superfamily protein PhnB
MTPPLPTVWPALRCRDAKGLIKFLTDAFGFEETLVAEDSGVIHHAELRWATGGGLLLGGARPSDDELHSQLPAGPASIYVVCDEPDALFERTQSGGAEVLQALKDEDYGSRGFTVRDPEGLEFRHLPGSLRWQTVPYSTRSTWSSPTWRRP